MKKVAYFKSEIVGMEDVSGTIKAIEKVAASHIHLLKKEVLHFQEQSSALEHVLKRISLFYPVARHPLFRQKKGGKKVLVVMSGDKGLVGGLHHELFSLFMKKRENYHGIIVLGRKGKRYFESENIPIEKSFVDFSSIPLQEEIAQMTKYLFSAFERGDYASVDVLYPAFVSLTEHVPKIKRILPINVGHGGGTFFEGDTRDGDGLPLFESSKKLVFGWFATKYVGLFFARIVMESKLSELSSRTVEMEHAKKKVEELIKKTMHEYASEQRKAVTMAQIERSATHKAVSRIGASI